MTNTITAALVRCFDKRHTANLGKAMIDFTGTKDIYDLSEAGGAGTLVGIFQVGFDSLVKKIRFCIDELGVNTIYLAVHGSSSEDEKGCGAYKAAKHEAEYSSPERSRAFSIEELRKARDVAADLFPGLPIRMFYITFGKNRENLVEEVS